MTTPDRTAALEALAAGRNYAGEASSSAPVQRTGEEVYAGGEERRLLISPAILTYREGSGDNSYLAYPSAKPGDVILISAAQAKRLDGLGVTVDEDTDLDTLGEQLDAGELTDDQLRAMNATDLVAYVTQNPDERPRVRALEEERGDKARKTVLAATEPTPETDASAEADAAARAAAPPTEGPGTGDGDGDPDVITE